MIDSLLAALALGGAALEPAVAADPEVEAALASVSPTRLRQHVEDLVSFGTRHTLSETASDRRGIGAARRWLVRAFVAAGGGRLRVEEQRFTAPAGPRVPQPTEVVNVLAWLPGEQAESARRVYVVSGHYDSRASDVLDATSDAPGADDDASGVAAVLEAARALAPLRHDATLLFAAVAGEEQGLLGSDALAARLVEEGYEVAGMITNDIVGSSRGGNGVSDAGRLRLFSEGLPEGAAGSEEEWKMLVATGGESDSPSRNLARRIREVAEARLPGFALTLIFRRDRYLRGGDHIPFLRRRLPAVRLTEPAEDFRHQHQDVREVDGVPHGDAIAWVDFDFLARVTRANAAALAELARAPAPPRGVALLTSELSHDSELVWDAGCEPDLAGYRMRIRETTAPTWQRSLDLGMTTRALLKGLSKDDVVFGVSAVDRDGHESPAVFPRPRR